MIQNLAFFPVARFIRQDNRLRGGVVPAFGWGFLIMPDIFASIRLQRDDGGEEKIVAFAIGADAMVPRVAIADAEVELIQFGIIDDRVPHRPTAAAFTPIALFGLCAPRAGRCGFQDFVAGGVIGFALGIGRGVEPPCLLASGCIISGDISARAKFRAAKANDDLVLHNARDSSDRAVRFQIKRLCAPILFSGSGIQRDKAAIDGADKNAAFPESDSAIDDVATGFDTTRLVDLGVEVPQGLSGFGVIGKDLGPSGRDKHLAIYNNRRRLLAARIGQVCKPCNAQILHIAVINQCQRAVPLLIIIKTSHGPVGAVAPGLQIVAVNRGKGWNVRFDRRFLARTQHQCRAHKCSRDQKLFCHDFSLPKGEAMLMAGSRPV